MRRKNRNFNWETCLLGLVVLCFGDNRWLLWIGVAFAAVIYINLEWLVSLGFGLVIVFVAPCLVMCIWHLALHTKPSDNDDYHDSTSRDK